MPVNPASNPLHELAVINAWAIETGVDRRTLTKRLAGIPPDGKAPGGHPTYSLETLNAALQEHAGREDTPVLDNPLRLIAESSEANLFARLMDDSGTTLPDVVVKHLNITQTAAKKMVAVCWLVLAERFNTYRRAGVFERDAGLNFDELAGAMFGRRFVSLPKAARIEWPDWMTKIFPDLPDGPLSDLLPPDEPQKPRRKKGVD